MWVPLPLLARPPSSCIQHGFPRSPMRRASGRPIVAGVDIVVRCLVGRSQCRRSCRGSASTAWRTTTSRQIVVLLRVVSTAGVRGSVPGTARSQRGSVAVPMRRGALRRRSLGSHRRRGSADTVSARSASTGPPPCLAAARLQPRRRTSSLCRHRHHFRRPLRCRHHIRRPLR